MFEVLAENQSFGAFGDFGAIDFSKLRGETAPAGIAAIKDALSAEFAHSHLGEAGGRIGAGEVSPHVCAIPDGSDADFPIGPGMTADEPSVRMASSQLC